MEFLIFIILLIVIYYIFRKKFKSANNDNQLLEETRGYTKKIIIALTILLGLTTFAQSETSWIKKKIKLKLSKK